MRKLLLTAVLVLTAQMSFAAVTAAKVKSYRNAIVEQAKAKSGETAEKARTRLAQNIASAEMFSISGKNINSNGLQKLITLEMSTDATDFPAVDMMIRAALTAKDSSQGVQQKTAADTLEIISHLADRLTLTGTKESRVKRLEEMTKLAENIGSLLQGNTQIGKNWADTFADLVKTPGMTLDAAIKGANEKTGKQISKEQIMSCKKG